MKRKMLNKQSASQSGVEWKYPVYTVQQSECVSSVYVAEFLMCKNVITLKLFEACCASCLNGFQLANPCIKGSLLFYDEHQPKALATLTGQIEHRLHRV
jgi:hypothetical protein